MSNLRTKLNAAQEELGAIRDRSNELHQKEDALYTKINEIKQQIVFEEGLLRTWKWDEARFGGAFALKAKTDDLFERKEDRLNTNALIALTWNGWHSCFEITPDIRLEYSDSDAYIVFDSPKLLKPFVLEYALDVSYDNVQAQIDKLEKEIKALRDLYDTHEKKSNPT